MSATGEAIRADFRTDSTSSLFMDNWGVDVVERYPDKIVEPIEAAVRLAQVMASIRDGKPVDSDSLDPAAVERIAFFDGTNEAEDYFFGIRLEPRYIRGSYPGERVNATMISGLVTLPFRDGVSIYSTYDFAWTTLRGDLISERDSGQFKRDLERINNAIANLSGVTQAELVTERPDSWPGEPDSMRAYKGGIARHNMTPVYIGESPLPGVTKEPVRRVFIPFLDS